MAVRWDLHPETLDTEVDARPLLRHLARDVADVERQLVPVDTGALRSGIYDDDPTRDSVRVYSGRHVTHLAGGKRGRATGEWHDVADDPKVPIYVEKGTRYMRAQPYMRPALYRYRDGR